jgi:signal transduction histidine kinase
MRGWLRGSRGGLIVFLLVAGLVCGGLGWMTVNLLRMEAEQEEARAKSEQATKLRLAVMHLDSCVIPDLAWEEGRFYNHYSVISRHNRALVQRKDRKGLLPDATVLQISPLLMTRLPEWMLLHFQVDESGWSSPQVPPTELVQMLRKANQGKEYPNQTEERKALLDDLKQKLKPKEFLAALAPLPQALTPIDRPVLLTQDNTPQVQFPAQQLVEQQAPGQPQQGFRGQGFPQSGQFGNPPFPFDRNRSGRIGQGRVNPDSQNMVTEVEEGTLFNDLLGQGTNWLNSANLRGNLSNEASLEVTPLARVWVRPDEKRDYLVLVRELLVKRNRSEKEAPDATNPAGRILQGVVLDVDMLRKDLLKALDKEFPGDFPGATLEPVGPESTADPLRTMTLLPLSLEPAPLTIPSLEGWTPLRIGLALAWVAALLALLAVACVGWSLIDLSERRFRFVSAVTHELRTPLTTLRLYLDMLLGGMVRDERQKEEYIRTLHDEADRLNRLVTNVLDFSRLEKQHPRIKRVPVFVADLLESLRGTWQGRCQDAGKQLVIENDLPSEVELTTDAELVQQVLGNLIDNSCKYSRDAEDAHIWLRVQRMNSRLLFEVEDRGPGIPPRERRAIFRAFRQGRATESTGGGVGLGLALAERWSRLLSGRLSLRSSGPGACFRLVLPLPM